MFLLCWCVLELNEEEQPAVAEVTEEEKRKKRKIYDKETKLNEARNRKNGYA